MTWASKERDWYKLVADIQSEIDANKEIIPIEHIRWIQHYLDHDEYSMAFEYLYLEIMERKESVFFLGKEKVREIALFFNLDDGNECMVDYLFWPKFQDFLDCPDAKGYQAHKDYNYGPGFEKEVILPSAKRVDALNWQTREVVGLKPNHPDIIRRGEKQVEDYRRELESITDEYWTCRVEIYEWRHTTDGGLKIS